MTCHSLIIRNDNLMKYISINRIVYIKMALIALLCLSACSHAQSRSADSSTNGAIIIEAEDNALAEGWSLKKEVAGYTGNGYIQWTGEETRETDKGEILYPITIDESGVYQIFARCHQDGAIWDASNDMFVQIATSRPIEGYPDIRKPEKAYVGSEFDYRLDKAQRQAARESLTNDWRWWIWGEEIRSVFRVSLEAGEHVLRITGRSHGFIIDRFAIIKAGDADYAQQPPAEILEKLTKASVFR